MKNSNSYLILGLIGLVVTAAIHIFMGMSNISSNIVNVVRFMYIVWFGLTLYGFVGTGRARPKKTRV